MVCSKERTWGAEGGNSTRNELQPDGTWLVLVGIGVKAGAGAAAFLAGARCVLGTHASLGRAVAASDVHHASLLDLLDLQPMQQLVTRPLRFGVLQ